MAILEKKVVVVERGELRVSCIIQSAFHSSAQPAQFTLSILRTPDALERLRFASVIAFKSTTTGNTEQTYSTTNPSNVTMLSTLFKTALL